MAYTISPLQAIETAVAMESIPHIPDHELLRRIGRGAYGEVWLARNLTGAYRAVKIVRRSSFDHDRPYEREFSGIQKYEPISRTHETQVVILHVGRNDAEGYFYYIMELADDRTTGSDVNPDSYEPWTLCSHIHQHGRTPIRESLDIGLHLASALDHIHKNGLVHRDVKPSNIVFIKGVPKLADVGLVTGADDTRSFVGTEGYIPPEGPGSPQADIYSLGKVLYEISTGRNRLDFPELPTLLKDFPEREELVQFNEVVLKACEENSKCRYQTAGEMLKDLWTLKSGRPIRRVQPGRNIKKLPIVILAAGISIVICGWPIAKFFRNGSQARHQVAVAPMSDSNAGVSAQTSFLNGLVAWWKADGNALDSAGTNSGTLEKGASFGAGKNGQAFLLNVHTNTYTDYISVPGSPTWAFGKDDFSIELWAKFTRTSATETQTFLASDDGEGNLNKWIFWKHNERLELHINHEASGGIWLSPPSKFDPVPGQWYHLAVTRGNSMLHFYVNGVEIRSEPWAGNIPSSVTPLTIGMAEGGNYFHGLLDDIRIYNRALSPDEIRVAATVLQPDARTLGTDGIRQNILSNPEEDLKRDLVSWWPTDGNALDSMHNNNGTIHGEIKFADSPSGKAFLFDGGYVEIPDSPSLRFSGPFSLALWMKISAYKNYLAAIITKGDHSWRLQRDFLGHSVLFSITGVNHSTFNGHPPIDLPATGVVDDGKWHHVAAVYDGTHEAIYIDGNLDVACPCSGFPSVDGSSVEIGSSSDAPTRTFNGELNDLRIYNRALSSSEIKILAAIRLEPNNGLPDSETDPRTIDSSRSIFNKRWTNSLGMVFVPVRGTKTWFSIWDTRVRDYRAYADANSGVDAGWQYPGFAQTEIEPVVDVSWNDARAFCAWLTRTEQRKRIIGPDQSYRLPTDVEWSVAVGLNEPSEGTPADKRGKIEGIYPWGTSWPPLDSTGNYHPSLNVDNYAYTSPVGSFAANQFGLYDMGGNVWQWCEDWYDENQENHVVRGASWRTGNARLMQSSWRDATYNCTNIIGFRCVLSNPSN